MTLEDSTQTTVSSDWDMMRRVPPSPVEETDSTRESGTAAAADADADAAAAAAADDDHDNNNDDADDVHKETDLDWDVVNDYVPKDTTSMNGLLSLKSKFIILLSDFSSPLFLVNCNSLIGRLVVLCRIPSQIAYNKMAGRTTECKILQGSLNQ